MVQSEEEIINCFKEIGLNEQKAKETLKNPPLTQTLLKILHEVRDVALSDGMGVLFYHLASKTKPQISHHLPTIIKYIVSKKLDSTVRVEKAIEYSLTHVNQSSFVLKDFESFCGVGVVVTPEEIERVVEGIIKEYLPELIEKRYSFNAGPIMQKVRSKLPWADGKCVKNEVDIQILDLLGPKTDKDLAPIGKNKGDANSNKKKGGPAKNNNSLPVEAVKVESKNIENVCGSSSSSSLTILEVMKKVNFHLPGENYKTDGYVVTENTDKLIKQHLKATGGKVVTRFPPEPNGILHIGHAKAININFGYAQVNEGMCYLRYDDTNPEKEEEKFFVGIKDMVKWLGYSPFKITHSSDYFNQLYEWAVVLIQKGLAYVCHQAAHEMKGFNPQPSPWRERPVEESLQLFQDMKNGKIDEGAATLRLKLTLEEGKLDPVAYRIRFIAHHRTGDAWCIYPTYDYTHCLCDSLENITHSLCTKEFQSRRSSYYWLCNALSIYCPVQWEYGRLNVNYTVVSKRKIARLIDERVVKDWDDPRLFTLTALRRRGCPPQAINNFCAQLGVTGAQSTVDPSMLDAYVRDFLNTSAPRRMVVLDPLEVEIENLPRLASGGRKEVQVPNFPNNLELGHHTVAFTGTIYIEATDFMEVGTKGYRRLTPTQAVGLRHAGYSLDVKRVIKDQEGKITKIICTGTEIEKVATKPKAFIHWVSDPDEIEVRLYAPLFKHKNPEDPAEVPDGFLSDCDRNSLQILKSLADKSLIETAKTFDKYQFERVGFFSVDPDSKKGKRLVFNKTVGLKEDSGK